MNVMDATGTPIDGGPTRNVSGIALANASRTTTQTTPDLANPYGSQVDVILDVTANAGGLGSVTVAINMKDPASGKYLNLLTSAAIVAVGTVILRVSPFMAAVANLVAQAHVPATLQIVVTANNANPVVYSVGYNLID